ncbi:MAG TPA: 3-carboxy-cis,cis-muconate cycloisomerase [Myxococcales bacterium]|jgi:3-carboxy-cis,cis-muconate cycloisomerase|nr:3-carboxy-cis,cis-muconate cycloisomerase [Myxococcales bacterium]
MHDALFASSAMREVFSDSARVQGLLDFEAALARAEARVGFIPAADAEAISKACDASLYDLQSLSAAAAGAGNLAIPLIKELRARTNDSVHRGATSQDAIDTGLMLQLRKALPLLEADAKRLADSLAALAASQRNTAMAGRTWMQQALPVTLGLKAAGWLDGLTRHRARLRGLRGNLVLQLGGAVGTLAAFEGQGLRVAAELASELGLALPGLPWHTQRDRLAEFATTFGMLVGSLGKIARDLSLLSQTEIGELNEPAEAGRGGSSTMPQKRNPVACAVALSAAVRVPPLVSTMLSAMVQEQERGLGGWHAEWETLPQIALLTSGALEQLAHAFAAPDISTRHIAANLALTHGLILAEAAVTKLTGSVGRKLAQSIVEAASQKALDEGRPLRELLTDHLSAADLDSLFEPARYLGEAGAFIDGALAAHQAE